MLLPCAYSVVAACVRAPLSKAMSLPVFALVPSEHRVQFRITGLTNDTFASMALGACSLSPSFTAAGYDWQLQLYLGGSNEVSKEHVSIFFHLASRATTTEEISCTFFTPDASSPARTTNWRKYTTKTPCPEGLVAGGSGWSKWVSHAAILAQPNVYFPGGVISFSISVQVRPRRNHLIKHHVIFEN